MKFEAGFDLKCQNMKELLDRFDPLMSTLTVILINTQQEQLHISSH